MSIKAILLLNLIAGENHEVNFDFFNDSTWNHQIHRLVCSISQAVNRSASCHVIIHAGPVVAKNRFTYI